MKDKNGVEYARYSSLREGDILRVDEGFDCIDEAVSVEVFKNEAGEFYVKCAHGRHFLNNEDDDSLIGFYPA